ncbi:HAD family hydrolase [Pseudoalteromonas byunsanensis]|uniref:HAD family hydrolase n=1 Tax=Pseudoalteromonas byunsanensis TaxID=327939 RepID=A0A1S1NEQ8_9GAMM|nr:HAD family phosphatase [Pseudoalteromonas byunsanensis]OHU98145.1 hypothetical protein BIW53_00015 [Pseudoalteromonas byunsanensis]
MAQFELVIFDCDGVLVDSEVLVSKVFKDMLYSLGLDLSLDEIMSSYVGITTQECLKKIEKNYPVKIPANFISVYREYCQEKINSELRNITGIEELIIELNSRKQLFCVASNSSMEKINLSLRKTNLLRYFNNRIYSACDLAKPKPLPDVFLHAASQFSISPSKCIVVEDTHIGVHAGVSANMFTVGYTGTMHKDKLITAGANVTIDKLPELLKYL